MKPLLKTYLREDLPRCGCGGTVMVKGRALSASYPYYAECSQCAIRTDNAKTAEDAAEAWRLAMSGKERTA